MNLRICRSLPFTLQLCFAVAALLVTYAPSVHAQADCDGTPTAVCGDTCQCDFAPSTKLIECSPNDTTGCNLGNGLKAGNKIRMTIELCNAGTQDPRECAPPGVLNMIDNAGSNYDLVNVSLEQWDPAVWNIVAFPVDGCRLLGDNLTCGSDDPTAQLLTNGACTTVVIDGDVSNPCSAQQCNQAKVIDPQGQPPNDLLGCTSDPNSPTPGSPTCRTINDVCAIDVQKNILAPNPPTSFTPGDTITYEICVQNLSNFTQTGVTISDFLPDAPGEIWIDKTPECIVPGSLGWDNADPSFNNITYDESGCVGVPDNPQVSFFGFDLGPAGDATDSVCISFDIKTTITIPNGQNVCNPGPSGGKVTSSQDPVGTVISPVCTQAIAGPVFAATKEPDSRLIDPGVGNTVTWTYSICNVGADATDVNQDVVITDDFSQALNCYDTTTFNLSAINATGLNPANITDAWNVPVLTITLSGEQWEPNDCIDFTVSFEVPAGADQLCCNTATIDYSFNGALQATTVDPNPVDPNNPEDSCFNTAAPPDAANLTATKDVPSIAGNPDPLPPRVAQPGDAFTYRIVLTEVDGLADATNVSVSDMLDTACIDLANFDPNTDIAVTGSGFALDVAAFPPSLSITGMTVPASGSVIIDFANLSLVDPSNGGNCCNQAGVRYQSIPADPNSTVNLQSDDPDLNVNPPDATCMAVAASAAATLSATKDVPVIDATNDPLPPRNVNLGSTFQYQIVLTEEGGVQDATQAVVSDTLDLNCIDDANFDPNTDIASPDCTFIVDTTTYPTIALMDITVLAGQSCTFNFTGLAISGTANPGTCCNQADVTYFQRPSDPDPVQVSTDDPDVNPGMSDPTCMTLPGGVMNLRREGVSNGECPLTARPAAPDVATIFGDGLTLVANVTLPWEEVDFKLEITDPNSPPGNSCLLYYQVEDSLATTIYMTTGSLPGNLLIDQ